MAPTSSDSSCQTLPGTLNFPLLKHLLCPFTTSLTSVAIPCYLALLYSLPGPLGEEHTSPTSVRELGSRGGLLGQSSAWALLSIGHSSPLLTIHREHPSSRVAQASFCRGGDTGQDPVCCALRTPSSLLSLKTTILILDV